MKQYAAKNIRNVLIAGHSGAGKTSLAEAMLYVAGATDRLGKTADGNTVCDFDAEEIKRKTSVSTAVAPLEWKDHKINVIDAPGLFDFVSGVNEGVRACECVIITVSARSGIPVGAEKANKAALQAGKARMFFVNQLDADTANFYKTFEGLKETFGSCVCPIVVPCIENDAVKCYVNLFENKAYEYVNGKLTECAIPELKHLDDFRAAINEAVAETSEELMEKFFNDEPFTAEELKAGISQGVKDGTLALLYCGAATEGQGADLLLNAITRFVPSPAEAAGETSEEGTEVKCDENDPAAAVIFKTVADPFVGKMSYFKVISGKLSADTPVVNMRTGTQEKIGKLIFVKGKKQEDTSCITAGDIGAATKLANAATGDTFCSPSRKVTLKGVDFPEPCLSMAILPVKKGEEDKIAQGLVKLAEEDPSIKYGTNTETHQMVVSGQGDQHIDVIVSKLKTKYGIDVTLETPRVAYRETIRKSTSVQGRHKKQSGGHGQFGDIWVRFEPCESDGLEFAEEVVGGSVPKNFFPAVEKGLQDCMKHGVLAGYPVVGVRAVLYDGSYHPVDSSEMAFKTAASLAFKAGIPQAAPTLLEPVGTLKALIPNDNMGDVMGEVSVRRGRVLGMNPAEDGLQELMAEVPMAEMGDFSTFMRQCSQGRGSFTFEFTRYEDCPGNIAQKVIEDAKAREGEE